MKKVFSLIAGILLLLPLSGKTYIVATNGSDSYPGTLNQPFATWHKGFSTVIAGDTVFIRGGTYYAQGTAFSGSVSGAYTTAKNGTAANRIVVQNYREEVPVLDCVNMTHPTSHFGIRLSSSNYWTIKGLKVKNARQTTGGATGIDIRTSNNNIVENCEVSYCGGPGITVLYESEGNILKNCDSHHNYDQVTGGENADGYIIGEQSYRASPRVNTMIGCRAWDNSDDGFDHYRANGLLIFEDCWAWRNGYQPGTDLKAVNGDGNGFKLGEANKDGAYSESRTLRRLKNCLAVNNYTRGISQEACNFNMRIENSISYGNKQQGFNFVLFNRRDTLVNNISDLNGGDTFQSSQYHKNSFWNADARITNADYASVDVTQLSRARKADGSLPDITAFKLLASSEAYVPTVVPIPDPVPDPAAAPVLFLGAVIENSSPSILTLNYDQVLDSVSYPTIDRFNVSVNGATRTPNKLVVTGKTVVLYMPVPFIMTDSILVSYVKPRTNLLVSIDGMQAPTLKSYSVTNNILFIPPVIPVDTLKNDTIYIDIKVINGKVIIN